MKKVLYDKGLVKIVKEEEKKRCKRCNRSVNNPISIYRAEKLLGEYGSSCASIIGDNIVSANESSRFGVFIDGMDFVDYFKRPKVKDIRKFNKKEVKGSKRIDVLESILRLRDGEYLHIPKDIELTPKVKNWRKKGYYIEVNLPKISDINRLGLSPKELSKSYIGKNFLAYSGIMYKSRADNTIRQFSLMSLIDGKKIAYLCNNENISEKIEIESDQGPNKILMVPSVTRKGRYHRVKLKNLAIKGEDNYSRAFDFDFESTNEDAFFNNLPWSNAGMPNGIQYRFSPIRPDRSTCAAIEHLMSREDTQNDILVDPRPVIPSNLACKFQNRMLNRVTYGSKLMDGQDIEVQLWMTSSHRSIGYEKMFD